MAPAIDPELNLVYWTFGNARVGGGDANDGSTRGGQNLFANSLVALDIDTGERRWHFQSVHHDIWDMDNVMSPVLIDADIKGEIRQLIIYGSKTGMHYILDRTNGSAPLGIEERPVPQDERQKTWPTQPYPIQGGFVELCVVEQPLGTEVPGDPNRAVPNFVPGCLFDPHWEEFVVSVPGIGGGSDTNLKSYSHSTGLLYTGVGYVATAHHRNERVGHRPIGEYMTGGVVAVDPTTNLTAWKIHLPYEMTHGNGALSTAGDLLFIGQPDGNLLGLDATSGEELWRFQTGAAVTSSPAAYEIDGEQYIVTLSGGTGLPYGGSAPRGDYLWAFRIGGDMEPAPTPEPPNQRRPVQGGPVDGSDVNYTVLLARTMSGTGGRGGGDNANGESTAPAAMAPTHMVVPVGTTVTFLNPADNEHVHCATQFFEGLFNAELAPGESFEYQFDEPGEFFFNDCYSPRSAGKIEVVAP
jgi:glucose dehydrogenase/plastocyanin